MNETNPVQIITDEISFFILYSSLIIDQSDFVSDKFSHEFFVKNLYLASGLRKKKASEKSSSSKTILRDTCHHYLITQVTLPHSDSGKSETPTEEMFDRQL